MRTLTVRFPMPINLANARLHWRAKHRHHEAWKTRAIVEERALRGRPEVMQRVRVTVVMYVSRWRMDDDNAFARIKWCLDLLKERGIIVDDKAPHLELAGRPEQRNTSPRRIELTLEELDGTGA